MSNTDVRVQVPPRAPTIKTRSRKISGLFCCFKNFLAHLCIWQICEISVLSNTLSNKITCFGKCFPWYGPSRLFPLCLDVYRYQVLSIPVHAQDIPGSVWLTYHALTTNFRQYDATRGSAKVAADIFSAVWQIPGKRSPAEMVCCPCVHIHAPACPATDCPCAISMQSDLSAIFPDRGLSLVSKT